MDAGLLMPAAARMRRKMRFLQTQAQGVGGLQQNAVASGRGGAQEPGDLVGRKNAGNRLGLFAVRDHGDEIGLAKRQSVK